MFSFLSGVPSTVLGGGDDGLFDLAAVEEFIQALEEYHDDVDNPGTASGVELQPENTECTLLLHSSPDLPSDASCPLPAEEEAIRDLQLPAVADTAKSAKQDLPDPILSDICKVQGNIITRNTPAESSETPGAPRHQPGNLDTFDAVPVVPTDHHVSFTDAQGSLSQSRTDTQLGAAGSLDSPSHVTRSPASGALDTVAVANRVHNSITPSQTPGMVSPVRSLNDIVLQNERGDEVEMLVYEEAAQNAGSYNNAPSGSSGTAAGLDQVSVPRCTVNEVVAERTVGQANPVKDVSAPVPESKAGKKKSVPESNVGKKKKSPPKGRRCETCKGDGHLSRDCPAKPTKPKQKKKHEVVLADQAAASGEETLEAGLPTEPAVLPVQPPSVPSQTTPIRLFGILGSPTVTAEDSGDDQRRPAFSLFGPSELTGQCSIKDPEPGRLGTIGPSHLTCDDSQQKVPALFGPSCLTENTMEHATSEENTRHAEALTGGPSRAASNSTGDVQNSLQKDPGTCLPDDSRNGARSQPQDGGLNFLQPSTLTDAHEPLCFGILGPCMLASTRPQSGAAEGELHVHWESDETVVNSPPERSVAEVISDLVPRLGSKRRARYARDELLSLRPSAAATLPTALPAVGEGYGMVVMRAVDRLLPVIAAGRDQPKASLGEKDLTVVLPPIAAGPAVVQGSHGVLPVGAKSSRTTPQPRASGQQKQHSQQAQPKQQKKKPSKQPQTQRTLGEQKPDAKPLPLFKTITAPHIEAWTYASMVYASPAGTLAGEFGPHHLVMWTDATAPDESNNRRLQALSITYRQPHAPPPSVPARGEPDSLWRDWAFTADVDRTSTRSIIDVLETLAVEVAVGIAAGEVSQSRDPAAVPVRKVTVFTDSQNALVYLHQQQGVGRSPIAGYAERLGQQGVDVELRWVPGHGGVVGNERADRLALLASEYAPAPERKGGLVRVPVPLLRVCESQVARMRAWSRGANQHVLRPFLDIQRRELKEALRTVGAEEGWLGDF